LYQPSATRPRFDKPAFSRFSQLFQPRLVVHSVGKIVKRQVCVCQKRRWVADGWFPNVRSAIQNLRLGSNFRTKILENETAGRVCIFEWLRTFVAQIENSHPSKVPRKDTPDLLFRFPKSFGAVVCHSLRRAKKVALSALGWNAYENVDKIL